MHDIDDRMEALRQNLDADTRICEHTLSNAPGGMIHAAVRMKRGVIEDLVLSGDFFFYEDHRHGLEEAFRGAKPTWEHLMTIAENYYLRNEVDSPGTDPSAWATAISSACEDTVE